MNIRLPKNPSLLVFLSALLLALGTYLQTVEVPIRMTSDASVADQTDLMHAFFPLTFAFWILAIVFLGHALTLWKRNSSNGAQIEKWRPTSGLVATVTLGALASISLFLPWVNVKAVTSGQFYALSGVDIIKSSYWLGDVLYLVFISTAIAVFFIPLILYIENKERISSKALLLFLVGGLCILYSAMSVLSIDSFWVRYSYAGGGGILSASLESMQIGLLVAIFSATGLMGTGLLLYLKPHKPV